MSTPSTADPGAQDQKQQSPATTERRTPIAIGNSGLRIADMDALWRFSGIVASSGLAPKGIQTREAIFVAVQMGFEIGLTPMAALQNIAPINGRPSVWGDAQLAIVRGTGLLEVFEEWFEAGGKRLPRNPATYTDDTVAVCRVKRKGYPAAEVGFSVADAKQANLWGKEGPWRQYPFRMLKARARSFSLRDQFGDALKGIMSTEEAGDIVDVRATTRQSARIEAAAEAHPAESQAPSAAASADVNPANESAAPANPTTDPAPEPGTLQNRLAAEIASWGYKFDQFREVVVGIGMLTGDEADAGSYLDLTNKTAQRVLNSLVGLKKTMVAKFGAPAQADGQEGGAQ